MMFPVVLLLEKKLLPDGGKSSYYQGVNTILFNILQLLYLVDTLGSIVDYLSGTVYITIRRFSSWHSTVWPTKM